MFTGIVTDLGRVAALERRGSLRIRIATGYDTGAIPTGASIACSGPCLTVVDKGPGWFAVEASAETLACTTLGAWREGTPVNLERPLRIGDELGGHIVLGHVDSTARVLDTKPEGDSVRFRFAAPGGMARFIAPKGSIALDGVSLTVNEVGDDTFSVLIIPHTLAVTTLGAARPGDAMNIEVDVMARHAARLLETR
jgi:riboflavin synthase